MRLLYCYVHFLNDKGKATPYRGLKKIEFNFSTREKYSYDFDTNTLTQKDRKCPLPENFWFCDLPRDSEADDPDKASDEKKAEGKTNIYNINVISGENGSGKTTAIHYLIDLLDGLHAVADPTIRDMDRMEKYRVIENRTLLLLEEAGKQYLLDYTPVEAESSRGLRLQGFLEDRLQIIHCRKRQNSSGELDERLEKFLALLGKTKVIFLTNTLSQHDYERHIGEKNERLRDFFVYDISLGSMIGPDVTQFFPYEVYKQVCYVFDRDQAKKRLAYKNRIPELVLPHALRLRLRTELLEKVFPTEDSPQWNGNNRDLSLLLGRLCAASFVENLNLLAYSPFYPPLMSGFKSPIKERLLQEELEAPIAYAKKQFERRFTIKSMKGHDYRITCAAVLPDGRVVSGSWDRTMRVWDPDTGCCLKTLTGHSNWVSCVSVLPDGRVVSGSDDKTLRVWDPDTGKCLQTLIGHSDSIICVTILSDGRVVSGSRDTTLRVWNPDTGKCLKTLEEHSKWVTCVAALPNGRVVSGSRDETLRVWDPDTGTCLQTLEGHSGPVNCTAILPNGRVVSGSSDATLRVWDANTGNCLKTLKGHSDWIRCTAILPDGRVISVSYDKTIRVWDANTGHCLQTLIGHDEWITCITVLQDRLIASCSDDKTLRVWDADTGRCLQILTEYSFPVSCAVALPDGRIVSGSHDGKIIVCGLVSVSEQTLTQAYEIAMSCFDYVLFLAEKADTLFSRFRRINERTYELSLKDLVNMVSQSLDHIERKENDPESDAKELYRDLIDFIQKYIQTCKPTYALDFDWGLSSGEENMLRLFSNLYHVFDRSYSGGKGVIYNNESHSDDDTEKTPCDTVLLFMDEADLTLHPEWQRRLILILAAFLPQLYPPDCVKDMQVILSTHSPLLLGDIPSENISYLPSKKNRSKDWADPSGLETFGENIHTILKESFFLENGTVGAFASKKINGLAKRLDEIRKQASGNEALSSTLVGELTEIKQEIRIVAPGVLRARLEQMYRSAEVEVRGREKTNVEKLLFDAQRLSPEQLSWLREALSQEYDIND